jgi:integrase
MLRARSGASILDCDRDALHAAVLSFTTVQKKGICDLQWQQIELSEGRLHVHRVKNGIPGVHPIRGDEMRALRKLRRDYPTDAHVFISERGGPIGSRTFGGDVDDGAREKSDETIGEYAR